MATYATAAELRTYTGKDATGLPDATANRQIEAAEKDVDWVCGSVAISETTGLMYDPTTLTVGKRRALMRATCAQAEYRLEQGDRFFVKPQYEQVRGLDFERRGVLPYIGPKVDRELAGSGLKKLVEVG